MEDLPRSDAVQLRVRKVEVVDPDRQIGRHAEFRLPLVGTNAL